MDGPRITSRQNPRVKTALELRERRHREARHQFLIDGVREINRALDAEVDIVQAFVCDELVRTDEARRARERLTAFSAEFVPVSPGVFAKLAFGDRADGLVAVATTPNVRLSDIELPSQPLVAVLDSVEKPGNLGAILRSADAAGVDAVVISGRGTDLFNPNTIRASLGTVFRHNVGVVPGDQVVAWLQEREMTIVAARPDAKQTLFEVNLTGPTALVLGSEAQGTSAIWAVSGATSVRLPMLGIADSLNVSATAAVLFYEALRQRTEMVCRNT
jgi:TrmH family RNA methyltransferase